MPRAVDDLDETIKIIRSTIFGLRAREGTARSGLRLCLRAVGEASPILGFTPSVRMEGLVDTDVPRETADQVWPYSPRPSPACTPTQAGPKWS